MTYRAHDDRFVVRDYDGRIITTTRDVHNARTWADKAFDVTPDPWRYPANGACTRNDLDVAAGVCVRCGLAFYTASDVNTAIEEHYTGGDR